MGHHRCQFTVAQGGANRQRTGHEPHQQQPPGRADLSHDVGRNDENSRADHRAGHDHGRIEKPEPTHKGWLRACNDRFGSWHYSSTDTTMFFFLKATPTTEIYTLSLHDAQPSESGQPES